MESTNKETTSSSRSAGTGLPLATVGQKSSHGESNTNMEMPPPPPPPDINEQITKPTSQAALQPQVSPQDLLEKYKPSKYNVGDLIWSKMTGHPWWPCMVTMDPLLRAYTKFTGKGMRTYHCQFFGSEAERGWVAESTTLLFEGRECYNQFVKNAISSAGTKAQRKSLHQKYEVRPARKHAWDSACAVAEHALTLDVEQRKLVYTFQYRDLPPDNESTASAQPPPSPTALSPPAKPAKPPRKRQLSSTSEKGAGKKSRMPSVKDSDVKSLGLTVDTQSSADPYAFDDAMDLQPPSALPPPRKKSVAKPSPKLATAQRKSISPKQSKAAEAPTTPKVKQKPVKQVAPVLKEYEIQRLTSISTIRRGGVCRICEQAGESLVQCQGPCLDTFHTECLPAKINPQTFNCDSCASGQHACFICYNTDENVIKCSHKDCGKFYHTTCIKAHPLGVLDGYKITCPLHVCATCARGDPNNPKASIGKLYKCVRCPTAYHSGDFCIAAGSVPIAGNSIACSSHIKRSKNAKNHQHINVNWCFVCSTGGTLMCCETCPAAFHAECLKVDLPDGAYQCQDCTIGLKPRYGDIVWVKLGSYRWWPSEICHPEHVPLNIQHKSHQFGEFPVHFLGSNDYYWTHQGRVFLYQEGDKASKDSASSKKMDVLYKLAVREAAHGYTLLKTIRESKEEDIARKYDTKPKKFKFIKVNMPIPPAHVLKVDKEQIPVCECSPFMENPCGDDKLCLNRMLMFECHPATCPAEGKCQNQRFQKRIYPKQQPFRCNDDRGWGLRSKVDIKAGEFVNEYVGELIDLAECKRRIDKAHQDNVTTFYMLHLDSKRVLDAGAKGNLARFANHSCKPNMNTRKWTVNGDLRIGLFAVEDIAAGTELTFNYNFESVGDVKLKCFCGTTECTGFLGERKKPAVNGLPTPTEKITKPKKKKTSSKPKHDDYCFRCLDGGELLICSRLKCTKAYHFACVQMDKKPHGRWDCPWHHCDTCGKAAHIFCHICPNSFCSDHTPRNVIVRDGLTFCSHHATGDIAEAVQKAELEKQARISSTPSTPRSVESSCSNDTEVSVAEKIKSFLNRQAS